MAWLSPKPMPVYAGEGSKGFRTHVGNGGSDGAAVGRAIGMSEIQVRGGRARDGELAFVDGAVMGPAECHKVFGECVPSSE